MKRSNSSPTSTVNVWLFTNFGPKVPVEIANHAELTNNAAVAECGEQAAVGTGDARDVRRAATASHLGAKAHPMR